MALTEKETVKALPKNTWLYHYVAHGLGQTTSPIAYHVGVGLTLLAASTPSDYHMKFAGKLYSNNYTLLVGRSGDDQKSTALSVGRRILEKVDKELLGAYPGSKEGLIESLARTPKQLIPISEMGKMLASAQNGYFEPIKATLTDLWDCTLQESAKVKKNIVRVENPRLSLMAACSLPYLEKYTSSEDWTGGFMGRWMVFYGERERTDPDPMGNPKFIPYLVSELSKRAKLKTAGECLGLTGAASMYWKDWFNDVVDRKLPQNVMGIQTRAPTMARKVALLLAWDMGHSMQGTPWHMDIDVLEPAIAITELHLKSLCHLSEKIADHPDARLRRNVLNVIQGQHGKCATLGEILGALKLRKRPVMEILDALKCEGRVQEIKLANQEIFYEYVESIPTRSVIT